MKKNHNSTKQKNNYVITKKNKTKKQIKILLRANEIFFLQYSSLLDWRGIIDVIDVIDVVDVIDVIDVAS